MRAERWDGAAAQGLGQQGGDVGAGQVQCRAGCQVLGGPRKQQVVGGAPKLGQGVYCGGVAGGVGERKDELARRSPAGMEEAL